MRLPPKVTRQVSKTSVSYETSSKTHTSSLQNERFVQDFLKKSHVKSPKLLELLPQQSLRRHLQLRSDQLLHRHRGGSRSHQLTGLPMVHSSPSSSSSVAPPLPGASASISERFVRDFLKNSHVKVCKTSVSYETSSKSQAEPPIGAHTSRRPAKQFRDSSPSKQHPLTRQSQCDSDIHLYHNSQPHNSLRLPRILPRPHV